VEADKALTSLPDDSDTPTDIYGVYLWRNIMFRPFNIYKHADCFLQKTCLRIQICQVLEVAMAAGFGSLRRFNDLFKKRYNLSPTSLRKRTTEEKRRNSGGIALALGYRPPYQWEKMLDFLSGRAIKGVEVVTNKEYMRTVHLQNTEGKSIYGWVQVGCIPDKNAIKVTVSDTLITVLSQVLARVRCLFDLYCDPNAIYETLHIMNDIAPGLCILGTRVPGCFDAFETAVRAVLGQQISVKAASTLASRIVETYGAPVQTGIEGLTHVFPSPEKIAALNGSIENHLGALGVTGARSRTIYELAQVFIKKEIDFDLCAQPEEEMKKLMQIRGIGGWTSQYIAMRAMGWPDVFLETDAGVKKALRPHTSKEILKMAEKWRPWRSYATMNLWNSL